MTTEQRIIAFDPIFDYMEFLNDGIVCDCRIIFPDNTEMKCHKMILSNSSKFFFNAFTGDMAEQATGVVNVNFNPGNLLQKVIKWMYNGRIELDETSKKELMQLYAIVHFYGIETLKADVEKKIDSVVNNNNILDYVDICYEEDLQEPLNALAPKIGKNIEKFDVKVLSDKLDVRVYSLAMRESGLSDDMRLIKMKEFVGTYELGEDEKQMLRDSLMTPITDRISKIFPALL